MTATVAVSEAHPGLMLRLAWWSIVRANRAARATAEVVVFLATPLRHDHYPVNARDAVVCPVCCRSYDPATGTWTR